MTKIEKAFQKLLSDNRDAELAEIKKLSNAIENGRYVVVKHYYGHVTNFAAFASKKDAKIAINLYQMYDDNCHLEISDTLAKGN